MLKLKGNCFLVIAFLLFVQTIHAQNLDEFDGNELSCPANEDVSNPIHLPYPNDCTKFYKCDRGVPIEQDCPDGLHWSINTDRCEWPNVAQCEQSNSGENDASNTSLSSSSSSSPSPSPSPSPNPDDNNNNNIDRPNPEDNNGYDNSNTTNGSLNYLCQGKNGDLLPYPGQCSKFILCSNGIAVAFNCPKELHWHDAVKKCDYQGNANCNIEIIPSGTSGTSSSSENVNTDVFEDFENQSSESIRHPSCPINEDPANPTHLAYPGDCTKFYKCDNGVAYVQNCPSGLHWNVNQNICDWPLNAECGQNIITESFRKISRADGPVKNSNCPITENPASPTQLPYPNDCTKFYKCFNGYAYPHNCPNGLHWNDNLKVCDWPSNAGCNIQAV